MIGYIIYLLCCGLSGFICGHLDLDLSRWEYWVLTLLPIITYICGRYVV